MNFTDPKTKEIARENLFKAMAVLNVEKIPFFLSNGTLLGAVRDNDFIAHDVDVDLGVFITDLKIDLHQTMLDSGFEEYGVYGTPDNGFQYSYKRLGVKLDIFFYYQEKDCTTMSVWAQDKQMKYIYPKFEKFGWITFQANYFRIPMNFEEYLTAQYGSWTTLEPNWDYAVSPKNIRHE